MIPNKFHFIQLSGQREFGLHHAICILSCNKVNNPESINVYYDVEPTGEYWDMVKNIVNKIQIKAPNEIFGKPIKHLAHKSDVIRLQILIEEGGIYCDNDTIFIKPYSIFRNNNVVLGKQGKNGNEGICPAVIMSEPNSEFIQKWLYGFNEHFLGGDPGTNTWCTHSVIYPAIMSEKYPSYITLANEDNFFYPTYHAEHLKLLFNDVVEFKNAYSFHLWETCSKEYLDKLNIEYIKNVDTTYNIIARKYV